MPPGSVRSSASLRNLFASRPLFRTPPLTSPPPSSAVLDALCCKQRNFAHLKTRPQTHIRLANHPLNSIRIHPSEVVHFEVTTGGAF